MASPASLAAPNSPMLTPNAGASLPPSSLDSSPPSRQVTSQALPPSFPGFSADLSTLDFEFLTSTSSDWELQPSATAPSTASGGSGSAWGSPPPPKPSPQQPQAHQTPNWERSSPSPRNHPWDNNSQPTTPYSPMMEDSEMPASGQSEPSTTNKDSARLRNLLTNSARQQAAPTNSPGNRHRILKGLLNQDDEEDDIDASTESAMDVASSTNTRPASNSSAAAASSTSNNHMLLKVNPHVLAAS